MSVHRHFLLHKPYGYLSQFKCNLPRKKLLGALHDFPTGTMPIGRLDEDSEGLILLSTDGIMSERIRSTEVEKEYLALLDGFISDQELATLRKGVEIGIRGSKYLTLPCKVHRLTLDPGFPPRIKKIRDDRHGPSCWISITINEGKERQIRKMTAGVGFPTLRLIRIRVGEMKLNGLLSGEVREVQSFFA